MTNKDDNKRGIGRYSSSQINRGLKLARKVSVLTVKTDTIQQINIEPINPSKYRQDTEKYLNNISSYAGNSCEEDFHYNRGIAYIKEKKFLAAMSEFEKVLLLNHNNTYACINLGIAKHYQGDFSGAIKEYILALKANPQCKLVRIKIAISKSHGGDKKGAIDDYNKLIKDDVNNSWAYIFFKAQVYFDLGNYLEYRKNCIAGYMLLAQEQLESRDYRGAIKFLSNVLELDPTNADAHNKRSTAKSVLGDYQGAMEDLNKVRMMS
jgi:tetratricopeptide (TPR) repeat protein